MPNFILRDARYSELPRVAEILTRAFWNDPLFGHVIHPHREEHPGGMELYWLRRARVNYWDYTWKWLVAVDLDKHGNDSIIGVAQWSRVGEDNRKMQCYWFDPRTLLKPLSQAAMSLHGLIWPNRACDPANENIIERGAPFLDSAWTGARQESWYLEFLAVEPHWQGKGVGKKLVQRGLKMAEDEGVCASVISAEGKDGFYRKCGFDVVDGRAGMGEGNPLSDIPGGNILWRMPK
ncbi:unnamed protein product [Discula destructiva]